MALDGSVPRRPPRTAQLFEAAALASQATVERGDPTEVALVAAAAAIGRGHREGRGVAHELLAPYPFDSFRKRMTLVRATDGGADRVRQGRAEGDAGALRGDSLECAHACR